MFDVEGRRTLGRGRYFPVSEQLSNIFLGQKGEWVSFVSAQGPLD